MSIPVGGDIGLDMNAETDQSLRLDVGRGVVQMGASKDQLTFHGQVSNGWCILVPTGTWHNITNTGNEPMQGYAIYAQGRLQKVASDAAAGNGDAPARWSVQPPVEPADQLWRIVCTSGFRAGGSGLTQQLD